MKKRLFHILLLLAIAQTTFGQTEICDNGIDDDFDNLVDLNDDDCVCTIVEPVSVIPNPSFEELDCCPEERSELNCASDWSQASEPTTDFIHTCGYLGWDQFPAPRPFPDGEGIMGFRDGRVRNNSDAEPLWKEYAGACLLSPLFADSTYRIQFDVGFVNPEKSPPIDITFFGTRDCEHLPFGIGNDNFGCPTNSADWVRLGQVRVDGGDGNRWINSLIEVTPEEDIYAIAIGPKCSPVFVPNSIYYFFDNLILANIETFNLQISDVNHPCSSDFSLVVPNNPDFDYQWYKDGIALVGETFSDLRDTYGEGVYQVRILDETSCKLSIGFEHTIPSFDTSPSIAICEGDIYQFGENQLSEAGFYLDTLKSSNNCDSIVALDLVVVGSRYDTIEASIFQGDVLEIAEFVLEEEGEHDLILTSSIGCDSLLLVNLNHFNVFFPNVFSPDGDGMNDTFHPFAPASEIDSYQLRIYNRWGNLLFEGSEWTGQNQQPGVYVYMCDISFAYGGEHTFFGSVTIVE